MMRPASALALSKPSFHRASFFLAAIAPCALMVVGCGADAIDAGVDGYVADHYVPADREPIDATLTQDATLDAAADAQATVDANTLLDANAGDDASANPDAQVDVDASANPDAQVDLDASANPDAQVDLDASANPDAQVDVDASVIPAVAFRMTDLDLRDPHTFIDVIGCRDITDMLIGGFSINADLQSTVQTDEDSDGFIDQSLTLVFPQYSQATPTQPMELHTARCSTTSDECSPGTIAPSTATATNMSAGQCLTTLAGTLRPYVPAVVSTSAPCFVSGVMPSVIIHVAGAPLALRNARIAATYDGNPATTLSNGLLMGFVREADANATLFPSDLALVGGQSLSSILRGGQGNCAAGTDLDSFESMPGWWVYMNFPATRVTWPQN